MPRKSRRSRSAQDRWEKFHLEQPTTPSTISVKAVSPPTGQEPFVESGTKETHPPCSRAPVSNSVGSSPPDKPFWSTGDVLPKVGPCRGTGYRHRVLRWPTSKLTGRSHKLVIPPESPDKKFVLIVGDSHLRAIADGFAVMPEGKFSFGVMSTPGAHAAQLQIEVLHADVPRSPDAVCVIAPSNNLTASRTIDEAAVDYTSYLTAVRSRWPEVFVLDFPPRLQVDETYQVLLRQEFHRVTARMGMRYFSVAEHFPLTRLDLWCRDGVHLSDREGMGILTQLLWTATEQFFKTPPPPPVSPTPLQPLRKVSPKLVLSGAVRAPLSPDPFEWKVVGQSSKVPVQASVAQQQEESFLPLNPVGFSSTILRAVEKLSPSQLSGVEGCKSPPASKKVASPAAAKRRRTVERRPPHRQSPVDNLVGSPPTRRSQRLKDKAPSSPVPRSRTTDGPPPRTQISVTNLAESPPVKLSCSLGDPETPCCSPVAKVPRMKTPSPAGPSKTIKAVAHQSLHTAKTQFPLSTSGPWISDDGLSPSSSPAKEASVKVSATVSGGQSVTVRASHSQADMRYSESSRNSQCTCMSLTFLAYENEGCHFNTPALDRVLAKGDSLYTSVKEQLKQKGRFISDHLCVEEMPKQVSTDTNMYDVHMSDIRCGSVKGNGSQGLGSLEEELQCLSGHVMHAFIIVSPECIAVFRDKSGRYGVFDSHARNSAGLPQDTRNLAGQPQDSGTAVMKTFTEIHYLADHLLKLFKNRLESASYEFVPVSFEAIGSREGLQQSSIEKVSRTGLPPANENILKLGKNQRQKAKRKQSSSKEQHAPVCHVKKVRSVYEKNKYDNCPEFRMKKIEADKRKYSQDSDHRKQRLLSFRDYYSKVQTKRESMIQRYKEDPAFRSRQKKYSINRYKKDLDFQNRKKNYIKDKYKMDPAFKTRQKNYIQDRYKSDPAFKTRQKNYIQDRYKSDPAFKTRQKNYIQDRYKSDPAFKTRQKNYIQHRYKSDPAFQSKRKSYFKDKYKTDPAFHMGWKMYMMTRYMSNQSFRQKKMEQFSARYHSDPEFRLRCIQRCSQRRVTKLSTDANFCIFYKIQRALRIKRKYRKIVPHNPRCSQAVINPVMEAAITAFRETIRHGPTYICTVCTRAMFPNQVKLCKRGNYTKKPTVAATCLTGKYVHFCNNDCAEHCSVTQERLQEWICHTCDSHLKRGLMPPVATANQLELAPMPPELATLNMLERQLIAKILPFAKVIALPKGQQKAVRGAVVCVPSEMEATVNSLPRPRSEAQLLQVKLKRRVNYKGYQHFYTVNMKNVLAGLATLKKIHSEYRDISINDGVTFDESVDEDDSQHNVADAAQPEQHQGDTEADLDLEEVFSSQNDPDPDARQQPEEADEEREELRPGLTLDTCMQPPDIAQEILSYGDGIFSIAPAQGNKPVGFFTIPKLEAMAFPVQFPTGENTLDEPRTVSLSPSMYFNSRLFAADTRFANDQTYLFFAQFVTETHLATNSMSIQMRKGKSRAQDGRRINNVMLLDRDEVQRLIMSQAATRFMQPLRGTPAYWKKTLSDVHAMVRQIGKPTFFATFSAAEMRWPEVIEIIKAQQGELGDFSELDWKAKCDILRSNPVTVMRVFEKRVDALMTNLILSPAQPIGEVEDYFYRVEFQARGSPHIHVLIWIKNAPKFEDSFDSEVSAFIDRYISCEMPDPETDLELHRIVSEVQVHSRKHSKSCKKGNVACRFGFPKVPMDETFITRPPTPDLSKMLDDEDAEAARLLEEKQTLAKMRKEAKAKLQQVRDLLMDASASFSSLSELLHRCSLTHKEYRELVNRLASGHVVILKRHPNNCWVNPYNPDLLRAWNANMDIQYVVDDYSCIMYMMSYVSKPEHEMTEFLKNVIKNVKRSDVNERDEMKQIMQAYVKHREVSAQEAVARTCSLRLKRCSRSVVFLQTDEDCLKMSHPISRLKEMEPGSEEVWMSGLPEKYLSRPLDPEFACMCMAEFASEYRVVYGRQTEGKSVVRLLNNMGFIQKRTAGKPAIIRYPRFSEKKTPEKFYRRLLKLYLPHRSDDELRDEAHPTYEQFYNRGQKLGMSVRCIVDLNKKRYEGQGRKLNKALEQYQVQGPIVNEWHSFAPEVEAERLECLAEREPDEHEDQEEVPEFQLKKDGKSSMPRIEAPQLSPDFVRNMYQNLNEMQASIFYGIRQWCFERVWGHDVEPFYYFLTGGAGCGKSHVIKCVHQEATRILRELPRFRDQADMSQPAVLLTAFTGTAAFNISGVTLHSVLKLPHSLKPPYQGLGNALDEVRAALSNAEILIIDEISMVSKELFAYVNWRFQQIRGNKKSFGGISVLAVGDFYQLPPPGRAKPLCVYEETELDLWKDHFKMVNLTEIMRQKDDRAFAELLNRLRMKQKHDPLSGADRGLLTQVVADIKDCPVDRLHIYATNKEVDRHNSGTVASLHEDAIEIVAQDYRKMPTTGCMTMVFDVKGGRRDLPDNIMAAQGVRVMLIRNLDVEDGIVNGTFGTISHIVMTESEPKCAKLIGLQLDNPTAGQRFRKKILGPSDNLAYIARSEENLNNKKGVVRRQFPMKLAFACTAHKVQGMTMASAVVCLKRVFEPGMAYVALSRTTSLGGLTICDFDEKKIYADPEIKTALENMPRASFQSCRPLLSFFQSLQQTPKVLTFVHHNTQGLPCHMVDLRAHHELQRADVLCLTETHLTGSSVAEIFQLEGYAMFTRSRQLSYNSCVDMAKKDGGGVAVYCRNDVQAEPRRYMQQVTDLEFVVLKIEDPVKVLLVTVYKPPNFQLGIFLQNLKNLLDSLDILNHQPIVVCGDFNEDLLSKGKKSINDLFQSRGYTQLIKESTTEKNTLIDHIYISRPDKCLQSGILQTYYSYHSPVYCILSD